MAGPIGPQSARQRRSQLIQRVNFIDPSARPQYPSLPRDLADVADIATNGEHFWAGDVAPEVARTLAKQGYAIVGGEVYCRRGVGWAAYLGEWVTSAAPTTESTWVEDVDRGLADALAAIECGPEAWGEPGEAAENLRFFFAATAPAGD